MSSYTEQLEAKLKASRDRVRMGREMKALKASAPTLFEIIDTEISFELNRGYNDSQPLSYNEYLESHGAVRGIRRIRNLIDGKEAEEVQAAQEVTAIQDTLQQIKDDQVNQQS